MQPRERATMEFVVECAEDDRLMAVNVTVLDGAHIQGSTLREKQRQRLGTTVVAGGYNTEKSEKEKSTGKNPQNQCSLPFISFLEFSVKRVSSFVDFSVKRVCITRLIKCDPLYFAL
ncbi:hypothetical protein Salat_2778800 [Sesamum alatum]|uniref:Uncharacterized protein n=1 Tax=Sesamum alatum TaxID=300844 RepID=A0AAE2C9G3_9LAMI|nr:hypothetical protein Salat_2778800 [Sesamum alatum]